MPITTTVEPRAFAIVFRARELKPKDTLITGAYEPGWLAEEDSSSSPPSEHYIWEDGDIYDIDPNTLEISLDGGIFFMPFDMVTHIFTEYINKDNSNNIIDGNISSEFDDTKI